MEYAKMLNGGAPLFMKYQVNETLANAGIVVLAPGANKAGVQISTVSGSTTSWANACGVTLDTATYVTAQQTDGTSAERKVTVLISPSALYRALMSGGGTEGTALTEYTISQATADGLDVTDTAITWTNPAWDEGSVFFTSGVNQGQLRKIVTTGGSNEGTNAVAFDGDHAVGDKFMKMPWWFMDDTSDFIEPTTNLYQADATVAVGTGGAAKIIDMELNGPSDSYVIFNLSDHTLGQTT